MAVFSLFTGCTTPDHSDEAAALSDEIVNEGFYDIGHAVAQADSAQQAVEVNGKAVSKPFQYHHPDIKLKDMLRR